MTDERLLQLIEIWGADIAAFPEAERSGAQARLAADPERFAAALREARALDAALVALPDIVPSTSLTEALVASAPKPASGRVRFRLPGLEPWAPASGLAALSVGLIAGLWAAPAASAASDMSEEESVLEHALGYDPVVFAEELDS